ncbi:hypothetical protein H5232_22325 [Pseudoalteromonas sp. SG41-5]|uniref:hypothetical protein n=1 Tax=Pseudoalteromonas sp. SG41-5 TaxID=2760975 RepID=UPI0015FF0D8F|nr:hypothetical protein [Pseudoalteromonas sp. SG41-5]MBB1471145.1 hypothetical protein [Pseudoalteromonas sp. SG41-5]
MELNARDMSLLLAGLKAVSLDNSYTSDQRRRAKELEDRIGNLFTTGCTLNMKVADAARCGEDKIVYATQSFSDFDQKQ